MTAATVESPGTPAESLSTQELQSQIVRGLQAILPTESVLWSSEQTTPYECDGLIRTPRRCFDAALGVKFVLTCITR